MPDTTSEVMAACARVQLQVWDYLDDRLAADARGLVLAHMAGCGACAQYFSFQERCRSALRALHRKRGAPWHVKARILDQPGNPFKMAYVVDGEVSRGRWQTRVVQDLQRA